ncbi:MAG TPA: hypothetical protein VN612_02055 [Acidobacteriaceae bacterium]|nr:hypothetical protein [Acidobacteriaceae bacterium]
MSAHTQWFVAPNRKDLVFVTGVAQPMRCGSAERALLIAAAPVLLEELQNATVQMDMAAECIEAGRYDEALLHVRSMKRKRTAIIAAATGETE